MANTEGLPDEVLEDLLSPSSVDWNNRHHAVQAGASNQSLASKRKAAMERRMRMMPPGDRPAARVVVRSPSNSTRLKSNNLQRNFPPNQEEPYEKMDKSSSESVKKPSEVVILGDIVERTIPRLQKQTVPSPQPATVESKPISRFFREQSIKGTAPSSGFPSVRGIPLGSLVKSNKLSKSSSVSAQTRSAEATTTTPEEPVSSSSSSTTTYQNNHLKSLMEVSSHDAQAMLAAMSPTEIEQSIQELQASLSPDMLAFLKKRRQARNHPPLSSSSNLEPSTSVVDQSSVVSKNFATWDQTAEKVRLGQLLASIQSYSDLDALYAKEMGLDLGEQGPEVQQHDGGHEKVDFDLACDLLRSTSFRQNLWAARCVYQRLQDDVASGRSFSVSSSKEGSWPYPTLLPVSLRCLLDVPPSYSTWPILHTYILGALNCLLLLRVSPDLAVDMTGPQAQESAVYVTYFMDDAVPTPPRSFLYPKTPVQPLSVEPHQPPAAYTTASTAASAQSDGEAFQRDPLWTLVSRMRIIPRLAYLLVSSEDAPNGRLPSEALGAICSILSLIAQRTPGVASAIVEHLSLLPSLKSQTLSEKDGSPCREPKRTLPTVSLLTVVARQSRHAASVLAEDVILTPFLVSTARSKAEFQLQQAVLIFWRTLLRYGLGISLLPTMLTLAAPHWAIGPHGEYSLVTDYYSVFTNVLDYLHIGKHSKDALETIDQDLIHDGGVWLSSVKRRCVQHLLSYVDRNHDDKVVSTRFLASAFRFMNSWILFAYWEEVVSVGESKVEDLSPSEAIACLAALEKVMAFDISAGVLIEYFGIFCQREEDDSNIYLEASSSAFMVALLEFLVTIGDAFFGPQLFDSKSSKAVSLLVEKYRSSLTAGLAQVESFDHRSPNVGRARQQWRNRTCESVFKFLMSAAGYGGRVKIAEMGMLRKLCIATIGNLSRGEEYAATSLLSYESIFCPGSYERSPVSIMLVRQLRLSSKARIQCDHSSLLRKTGKDCALNLNSLLSEAELELAMDDYDEQLLLPMGQLWLWQLLSGAIVDHNTGPSEAIEVIASALSLIIDIESHCVGTQCLNSLDRGRKLYHLLSICLHPEQVICEERVTTPASRVLEFLAQDIDGDVVQALVSACSSQASPKSSSRGTGGDSWDLGKTPGEKEAANYRPLSMFVAELCDNLIAYGAQYPFCTSSMRIFLMASFPSFVRCEVIHRLREVLHLFSASDIADSIAFIHRCLPGACEDSILHSPRDSPNLLDVLGSLLTKNGKAEPLHDSLIWHLANVLLARNIAVSIANRNHAGLLASRRRVLNIEESLASQLLCTTEMILSSSIVTNKELVLYYFSHHVPYKVQSNNGAWERLLGLLDDKGAKKSAVT